MSRSRKKTPIIGMTTAASDKRFKVAEHSRERSAVRVALAKEVDTPSPKAFGDPWKAEKDGKQYVPHLPNLLRK